MFNATHKARAPRFAFQGLRRHWLGGSRAATHLVNGVNLLFPGGERFFVRSVRHYVDRITPDLAERVRTLFFAQEGRHAQAHEKLFDVMRAQGLDIDPVLERYHHVAYDWIEKASPPAVRLSVTVAVEHFTATMAEGALTARSLEPADPDVRRLLEWHAVEELEHKAVAFDVLEQVAPSYALRMLGLMLATVTLGGFWIFATRELLHQDGSSLREAARELRGLREAAVERGDRDAHETIVTGVFLRGIREYIRPGFHPMQRDHEKLIADTLSRLAAEGFIEDVLHEPRRSA
jgi:predicted metal-dependent hydrolase